MASFAGDNEYSPDIAYSTGTVLPPVLAETVERLENIMVQLKVATDTLTSKIDSLTTAIDENRVGLGVNIANGQSTTEYEHSEIDAQVEITGTNIEVRVDSSVENGKTVLINIDNYTKDVLQLDHIAVWIDNEEITQADDYDDVLDPTNDGGEAEYLILAGGNGIQVLVSIPHFSARTVVIGAMPATGGIPPPYVVLAATLGLVIATVAAVFYRLQKSREETTSLLIDHGLTDMRIAEEEIVREIRGMKEFTIPDLMQKTGAHKTMVRRTVHKLMENNLVQQTGYTKRTAGGLGGRGKPSTVYKYVGN
jgi:predicted transcriptional regulator